MEIRNGTRIDTHLNIKAPSNLNILNQEEVQSAKKAGILKAITRACKEFVAATGREPTTIYVGSTEHSQMKEALNEFEEAKAKAVTTVQLVTPAHNHGAIAFYKKLGGRSTTKEWFTFELPEWLDSELLN
jgi:hypothetical protein